MSKEATILSLLAKHAKVETVEKEQLLFGGGVDLTSVTFAELAFELEDAFDVEIDIDDMDSSVQTVGQFVEFVESKL